MTVSSLPPALEGTWPVRLHADRFYGTLKMDGQHPRVAALACHQGNLVALSLVGYDTSTSAVLASLWLYEEVPFLVGEGVKWTGPRNLKRRSAAYKQFSTQLAGTREMHYIALTGSAHIAEGILNPPDLPNPKKKDTMTDQSRASSPAIAPPTPDRMRFVLGNWDEETPHPRSFLGHLYGMRVLFLHRDSDHPDWPEIWARELWARALVRKLIQPVKEALGVKVWVLRGDLDAWGRLCGDGARAGWLPWQATAPQEE